ncbi:MAG: permease [Bacteroidales bacterium]|nr:permease [Bacteroidales bacterium]
MLNPYIIILSLSVMGVKYSIIRIVSAFVLAILSGIVVEWISKQFCKVEIGKFENCNTECSTFSNDLFVKTLVMVKKLLPYILIGGVISFSIEMFNPKQYLALFNFSNEWITMPIMLLIGIPLYVCNGADIFILKPLLDYTDLSLGASMVFSLTSSSICISSIVMLSKFLGKRITAIFVISIAVLSLLIGIAINVIV